MFPDKPAKEIKIEWELSTVCPDVSIAETAPLMKSDPVKYFEKPDSIKCGLIKKVSGKMDTVDCTPLENVDPTNIYFKTDLADPTKCLIEATAGPTTIGQNTAGPTTVGNNISFIGFINYFKPLHILCRTLPVVTAIMIIIKKSFKVIFMTLIYLNHHSFNNIFLFQTLQFW